MINENDFKTFLAIRKLKKKKTYSSEVVKVPRVWSAVSNSTPGTSRAAGVGNIVTI